MRSLFGRPFVAVFLGALLVTAPTALAQEAGWIELTAGYLNVNGTMHGADLQISLDATRRWTIVGEVAGAYGPDCGGCEPDFRDVAALGGVRFSWHPTPRVAPFWHAFAGYLNSTALGYTYTVGIAGRTEERYQEPYTIDYFVLQPGGGITVMMTPRLGIRGQVDLQFNTPVSPGWQGEGMAGSFEASRAA
jgi:hypothetical protein